MRPLSYHKYCQHPHTMTVTVAWCQEWPLKLYRRDDGIMASAPQIIISVHEFLSPWFEMLKTDIGAGLIPRLLHMPGNEASYCTSTTVIASFPGRSRLQFLITCSMQKWRGKAWEKESLAWRRHAGGHCPIKNVEVLLVKSCLKTWGCNVWKQVSLCCLLFDRFEADQQKVCGLQRSAPSLTHLNHTYI